MFRLISDNIETEHMERCLEKNSWIPNHWEQRVQLFQIVSLTLKLIQNRSSNTLQDIFSMH